MTKKCTECVYSMCQDFGYSNWTVEGSTFSCTKGLHPDGSFDRWYGTDKRLSFAENCTTFLRGDGIDLDVDLEGVPWKVSEEDKEITTEERVFKYYGNGYITLEEFKEYFNV